MSSASAPVTSAITIDPVTCGLNSSHTRPRLGARLSDIAIATIGATTAPITTIHAAMIQIGPASSAFGHAPASTTSAAESCRTAHAATIDSTPITPSSGSDVASAAAARAG